MDRHSIRVLLVADDTIDGEQVRRTFAALESPQFLIESVGKLAQAVELACVNSFDVVLLALGMPDSPRRETLARFREACGEKLPFIILTSLANGQAALEAPGCSAQDYVDIEDLTPGLLLRSSCYAALRHHRSRRLKTSNELLVEKNRRLAHLCDTAQQFVENVSHEFRTPLTVIREFTSIILDGLDGPVTDKQAEHLSKVLHRTDDLALMVDEMLDISRFEAGQLAVWRKKCHANDLIGDVVALLKGRAASKRVTLSANASESLPMVFCDEEKARRVITNLTINSIRFAPEGGQVEVWARNTDNQTDIKIGARGNGPGISNENLDLPCERFQQVDQHLNGSTKGLRLGLNFAKELVGLNLGLINVETKPNIGDTFSFTLPLFAPRILIDRFLDRLAFLGPSLFDISLLTVEGEVRSCKPPTVIDEFLQRAVRTSDLVMPGSEGNWIITAPCSEVECGQLIQRLTTEWSDFTRNSLHVAARPLQIQFHRTWSIPDQREEFTKAFVRLCDRNTGNLWPMPAVLAVDDGHEVSRCHSVRQGAVRFQALAATDGKAGLVVDRLRGPDASSLMFGYQQKTVL